MSEFQTNTNVINQLNNGRQYCQDNVQQHQIKRWCMLDVLELRVAVNPTPRNQLSTPSDFSRRLAAALRWAQLQPP
jgi:hypothetical protein